MLAILTILFALAWAYTEWRNWQLRAEVAQLKLDNGLTAEVLKISTDTLRKQTEEIKRLRKERGEQC